MRARKIWAISIVAAVVTGSAMIAPAAYAVDFFQFCGMASNTGMTGIRGARVNIERYNPRVATQSSSAWSMADNHAGSGSYAQVGWLELNSKSNNPYYFWEYADSTGFDLGPVFRDPVPNGGDYTGADDLFTVQYVSGDIKYRINGVVQATTYNPDWTPDQAEFHCEVHNGDPDTDPQIGGDSNHKVDFTNPAFYSMNDDLWHSFNPYGTNNTMYNTSEHGNWQKCQTNDDPKFFKVWDLRYNSLP